MIYILGDTHGTKDIKKLFDLKQNNTLCTDDYVIICGDSCIISDENLIELYESFGAYILFIDGNHDNYDMLREYPVTIWNGGKIHKISPHIFHLMRGQIFNICSKCFLTLGGANSLDLETKKEGKTWWKEERISEQDINETLKNLKPVNNSVDYVITHTCPDNFLQSIETHFFLINQDIPQDVSRKLTKTNSGQKLNEVIQNLNFKKWFCGHWHHDICIGNELVILFNNIAMIE
jgi:hypothetical protein